MTSSLTPETITLLFAAAFGTLVLWRSFHPAPQDGGGSERISSRQLKKALWAEEKKKRRLASPPDAAALEPKNKEKSKGKKKSMLSTEGRPPAELERSSRVDAGLFNCQAPDTRSFLYVVGGRFRGRTLTVVERLDITGVISGLGLSKDTDASPSWERCPQLLNNRGRCRKKVNFTPTSKVKI
jgi:hypothetical protein